MTETTTSPAATQPVDNFDFYVGHWAVTNRRLRSPLTGSDDWYEFPGTSTGHRYCDGAVNVDEISFPDQGFRGLTVRTLDPATGEWSLRWINSRDGRLDTPVVGRWQDGKLVAYATEEINGRETVVRFVWSDITAGSCRWEQAFSVDGGTTWEPNWIMESTRLTDPPELTPLPRRTSDFDFCAGTWRVHNRRLTTPLDAGGEWVEATATSRGALFHSGAVNIDEVVFDNGAYGLAIRTFAQASGTWSVYWVSSRDGQLQPPVHGTFDGDGCEFFGDDVHDGTPVRARYRWSGTTGPTPRWEQDFSTDGGKTWITNWIADHTRV